VIYDFHSNASVIYRWNFNLIFYQCMPIDMKDLALCTKWAQRYFNAGHGVGTKSTKKICW